MPNNKTRKKLKQIEKELSDLEKERQKIEFRPCRGDADLKEKEENLQAMKEKIRELEHSRDRFILDSGSVQHFRWQDSTPKE
jgi:chromosome segregation ATPase